MTDALGVSHNEGKDMDFAKASIALQSLVSLLMLAGLVWLWTRKDDDGDDL